MILPYGCTEGFAFMVKDLVDVLERVMEFAHSALSKTSHDRNLQYYEAQAINALVRIQGRPLRSDERALIEAVCQYERLLCCPHCCEMNEQQFQHSPLGAQWRYCLTCANLFEVQVPASVAPVEPDAPQFAPVITGTHRVDHARAAFWGVRPALMDLVRHKRGYILEGEFYLANGCTLAECIETVAALGTPELLAALEKSGVCL